MLKTIRSKVFLTLPAILFLMMSFPACSIDLSQKPTATKQAQHQTGSSKLPKMSIPVTWATLNLTGSLVFAMIDSQTGIASIKSLNLSNGEISTIFQAPDKSRINFSSVSPDGKQVVISYSAPPGRTSPSEPLLYLLPMDGSAPPKLLFPPPSEWDQYNHPVWSPDGKYIYFIHITFSSVTSQGQQIQSIEIERMAYPDGQPENVVQDAFWPRVSAASKHIVYVSIDLPNGTNRLFLANADGSDPQNIALTGNSIPSYINAPIFSPDGQSILFSSPLSTQSYVPASPTRFDELFAVTAASAHFIPTDWFSVPLTGGMPTQITHLQTTGLYASISPNNRYIASSSGIGLFVMNPDGSNLTVLMNNTIGDLSTVSWIP